MNEVLGIIDGVASFAALLGGALAAMFFCWSGFLWMTGMGDPQKMAQAWGSLIGAAVGWIIVGTAFIAPRVKGGGMGLLKKSKRTRRSCTGWSVSQRATAAFICAPAVVA